MDQGRVDDLPARGLALKVQHGGRVFRSALSGLDGCGCGTVERATPGTMLAPQSIARAARCWSRCAQRRWEGPPQNSPGLRALRSGHARGKCHVGPPTASTARNKVPHRIGETPTRMALRPWRPSNQHDFVCSLRERTEELISGIWPANIVSALCSARCPESTTKCVTTTCSASIGSCRARIAGVSPGINPDEARFDTTGPWICLKVGKRRGQDVT